MRNMGKIIAGILGGLIIVGGGAYMAGKASNVPKEVIVVSEEKKDDVVDIKEENKIVEQNKKILKAECGEEFLKDMKIVYNITVEDCTKFETTGERYAICENIQRKWKDERLNESETNLFESLWFERKYGLYRFLPPIMDEVPATRKAINENLGKLKELGYLFEEV